MNFARIYAGIALPVIVALGPAPTAQAQLVDYAQRTEVARLIELSGAAQGAEQMIALILPPIIDSLRASNPDLPERALTVAQEVLTTELRRRVTGEGGLIEKLIPVYEKHYSPEEIQELIAFYESALGRKMVKLLPVLMQEGATAGQQWATEHMPAVTDILLDRLRQEGYLE
jgi:uncharacterized protein